MKGRILTKEEFISVMNAMMDVSDFYDLLYRDCVGYMKNQHDRITKEADIELPTLEDELVDVLAAMFDDKDELLAWWCFEQNYGRDLKSGDVKDAKGNDIDISTASKLYDFLVKDNE